MNDIYERGQAAIKAPAIGTGPPHRLGADDGWLPIKDSNLPPSG
jgi:hypothetical protein